MRAFQRIVGITAILRTSISLLASCYRATDGLGDNGFKRLPDCNCLWW